MTNENAHTFGLSALDVAKWFINATDRDSGDSITHLKVQKLVYYAQGWSLAYFGKTLFEEDFQAWAHGPVAVSVWEKFRGVGFEALPEQKITRKIPSEIIDLLEAINQQYGIFSAKKLEMMTHKEYPWLIARGEISPEARCNNVISKDEIKKHFVSLKP